LYLTADRRLPGEEPVVVLGWGNPIGPLLRSMGWEHAAGCLPAGEAGLRLGRRACSGRVEARSAMSDSLLRLAAIAHTAKT